MLAAAADIGGLVTNDLVLGRRASNLGARWLRTADLVLLSRRTGVIDRARTSQVISSLHAAGRLTAELRDAYLEEIG